MNFLRFKDLLFSLLSSVLGFFLVFFLTRGQTESFSSVFLFEFIRTQQKTGINETGLFSWAVRTIQRKFLKNRYRVVRVTKIFSMNFGPDNETETLP